MLDEVISLDRALVADVDQPVFAVAAEPAMITHQ
jgi:hypothetical protein